MTDIDLSPELRKALEKWARGRTTPHRVVLRSRIILALADGLSSSQVADRLAVSVKTVRLWQQRFLAEGVPALTVDAPGRGRKPRLDANVVAAALESADGARPTVRQLARKLGTSASAVQRALNKTRAAKKRPAKSET